MRLRLPWHRQDHLPASTAKLPTWALPVAGPEQLLQEEPCPCLVQRTRELMALPEAHWQHLVLSALHRYAAYAQRLDEPETLAGVLERIVKGLRIRRSRLLPPGASPEIVARDADRWSYAVFSATLLQNLEQHFLNRQVEIFSNSGRSMGYWNPWRGSLCEIEHCIAYLPETQTRELTTTDNSLLFASRIIPDRAIAWLAEDGSLLRMWRASVCGRWEQSGILGEILTDQNIRKGRFRERKTHVGQQTPILTGLNADGCAVPNLISLSDSTHTADPTESQGIAASDAGEQFLDWLRAGLADGTLEVNTKDALIFGLREQRILLSSPYIFKRYVSDCSPAGEDWESVQKHLQKKALHLKADGGSSFHRYCSGNKKISGFVLPGFILGTRAADIDPGPLLGPL